MNQNKIFILGLPVDRVNKEEVVIKIDKMMEHYVKQNSPSYVATLNADFLANVHGWDMNHPYHLELIKILREADLLVADGNPLLWISSWFGNPLKEKITGQEMFIYLAEHLAKNGKSIYILGGLKNIAHLAAEKLQNAFPHLRIVGISAPFILTKGERLEESYERDSLIIEAINQAAPDLLFIQLGHPKQEIWFERIRSKLRVPVTVGIGGAFEKYIGKEEIAPKWMSDNKLEWLYRAYRSPLKLWGRYTLDFFKLLFLGLPAVIYYRINEIWTKVANYKKIKSDQSHDFLFLFLSSTTTMAVLSLPILLDENNISNFLKAYQEASEQDVIILDFLKALHIDLVGLGTLFQVLQDAREKKKNIYALNVSMHVKLLMILNGFWDCISSDNCESSSDIIKRLRLDGQLFESIQQVNEQVILSFMGELTNTNDYEKLLMQIKPILQGKDCIVNLTYCNGIENRGFTFLLNINEYQKNNKKELILKGANSDVKRQFKIVKLEHLLK